MSLPASSVTGTTLDAQGHPLPLAEVTASTGHRTTSDTHGRFELKGLSTGPDGGDVQLKIHSRWIPPSRAKPVTFALAPGMRVTGVELRVDLSHSVAGVALNATGEPMAGAKVWLELDLPGRRRHAPIRSVRTDRRGRFRFGDLPAATFTVTADEGDTVQVTTGPDATAALELELPR